MPTDEQSLEQAVQELSPRLLRYGYARARDWSLAEDATQEALAALVRRWRRRGAPMSPEAFCFAIARRRIARGQRALQALVPMEETVAHDPRHEAPDPEVRLFQTEEIEGLLRALQQLKADDRDALLLVGVAGVRGAAAAEIQGLSHGAFRMRLHRARQELRRRLEAAPRRAPTEESLQAPAATQPGGSRRSAPRKGRR